MVATLSFSFASSLELSKTIRKDQRISPPNSWQFSIPVQSPAAPFHSPLPLPHHPQPPTPLCLFLSLTTRTLPLPPSTPSPPTPSHSPLPLPHHPHPPTPLCLSTHLSRRRNSASLFVALADSTATDNPLSTTIHQTQLQPHSREERDCYETTEQRHSRPRDLPRRLHNHRDSDWTHLTSLPSITPCIGAVWSLRGHLATQPSLSSRQLTRQQTMRGQSRVKENGADEEFPCSPDSSAFLNWDENKPGSVDEMAVIYRSLAATVKSQHALDDSLEAKAVKLLYCIAPRSEESADAFLSNFASSSDYSLTDFITSIIVLVSTSSQIMIATAMEMLNDLPTNCSTLNTLALVKADVIPQLIITLNSQSLSFAEAVDIHTGLMSTISTFL
ncbi:hypothetical protein BLNAU_19153 [Blattamonas nauphoetae]|uniref:Uncharacterized protein n=1 Tax=Blattamonas nauphoetae TaxID=2049346 RepID=A0ABQ9X2E0_9EUKA|nr:hypothetical protein BLNAU_19153 [Blattamonas nauphoetae]